MKKDFKYFSLLLLLVFMSCAKRGTINGGPKDTIPPILKGSLPNNYSTNFNGNTIRLTFDEYVKIKNANKQLIVSPPMIKAPDISPITASKSIIIKIKDTLQPNTTYSFNFGQSIEDNNEGNPYKQFKYVFSTGSYIDSLSLSGTIKDAYNKEADSFVTVMLYEVNEKFSDSVVYKQNPRYITNTLDSAKVFKLENLKAGKYLLVALKDVANNYKFDPRTDKIGFHKEYITVPNDTLYEVELFRETIPFKTLKPTQASGNRLLMGYEGNPKDAKIQLTKANENFASVVTKFPKKDSLQIWFKPLKIEPNKSDSIRLAISKGAYNEDYIIKIRNQKKDTLSLNLKESGVLPLGEKFTIESSIPLQKFESSKMKLTNKDSIVVPFKTEYDEMTMELKFDFLKEPLQKYKLQLLPGAITDYMGTVNDTLSYNFDTKSAADYGNLRLSLEHVRQFPLIIELTNKAGDIMYSAYSESATEIEFNLIKPDLYRLRVIYDENKNKEWDSGSYLQKRQSEEVIYFPEEINVHANWDWVQSFNLKP